MRIREVFFRDNPDLEKYARETSHFVFSNSSDDSEKKLLLIGESIDIYDDKNGTSITLSVRSKDSATVAVKEGRSLVFHFWKTGEFTRRGFEEGKRDIGAEVGFDEAIVFLTFPGGKVEIVE